MEFFSGIVNELQATAKILVDPDQRLYWGYLAGALAIAALVYLRTQKVRSWRGLGLYLFSPKIWFHPSSRTDAGLLISNRLIRALLIAPLTFTAFGLALWLVTTLDEAFGRPSPLSMPAWAVTGMYTVALFLAWDVSRYWVHRWFHTIPILWEFHQVHHSAEVMTPVCLYRAHPVESIGGDLRGVLVTGVMTGVFFYFFRGAAVEMSLLGVNVFGFVLNAAGGNLRHSHVPLGYGRFEKYLISPAQHQIHHSVDPDDYQKNFGTWLSVWDRMWGSFKPSTPGQRLKFGIPEDERNHNPHSVVSSVVQPILSLGRKFRNTPSGNAKPPATPSSPL